MGIRVTAQELYQKLLDEENIKAITGEMKFSFGSVNMIIKQHDVVGNIMQEWLEGWLTNKGIDYAVNDNKQMPPDFYLNPENREKDLLEVKAFYCGRGPGFDIAGFTPFLKELEAKPYILNTDYLIFSYDVDENGKVSVTDLWLKKIWDITRRSDNWGINLQVKAGVVHKIRPGIWYGDESNRKQFKNFESMGDFISAFNYTALNNADTQRDANGWIGRFTHAYERYYGIRLRIPQWQDIADKYDLTAQHEYDKKCKEKEEKDLQLNKEIERINNKVAELTETNPMTKKAHLIREQITKAETKRDALEVAIGELSDEIARLEGTLNP